MAGKKEEERRRKKKKNKWQEHIKEVVRKTSKPAGNAARNKKAIS